MEVGAFVARLDAHLDQRELERRAHTCRPSWISA
jgi:hypothetical protein